MKKLYFKKWVEYSLIIINILLYASLAGDTDNIFIFIASKLIASVLFAFNYKLLEKYGRLFN